MPFRCARIATQGSQWAARSLPVKTFNTPGIFNASAASMLTIRACACGLRAKATCTMRGRIMSSTYWPRPSTSFLAFGRGIDLPM